MRKQESTKSRRRTQCLYVIFVTLVIVALFTTSSVDNVSPRRGDVIDAPSTGGAASRQIEPARQDILQEQTTEQQQPQDQVNTQSKPKKLDINIPAAVVKQCASNDFPRFPIVVVHNTILGQYQACYEPSKDIVCRHIFEDGHWEKGLYQLLQAAYSVVNYLVMQKGGKNRPIYIDIGGNVGSLAIPMAGSGVETHVFEMMPRNMQLLTVSRCLNKLTDGMHLYHTGLGNKDGTCYMVHSASNNFGDASLKCGIDPKDFESVESQKARRAEHIYEIAGSVSIRRLDDIITQPDETGRKILDRMSNEDLTSVLKIDVEGSEIIVMEGAPKLLSHENRPKFILSEVWRSLNITRYGEIMISPENKYVGFVPSLKMFLRNMNDVRRFHKIIPKEIDDVLWLHGVEVEDFVTDYFKLNTKE